MQTSPFVRIFYAHRVWLLFTSSIMPLTTIYASCSHEPFDNKLTVWMTLRFSFLYDFSFSLSLLSLSLYIYEISILRNGEYMCRMHNPDFIPFIIQMAIWQKSHPMKRLVLNSLLCLSWQFFRWILQFWFYANQKEQIISDRWSTAKSRLFTRRRRKKKRKMHKK